jgi:CBS domain-containing protein
VIQSGENRVLLYYQPPFYLSPANLKLGFFATEPVAFSIPSPRRRQNMKCREIMSKNPVFCLPENNVGQAARVMRREHLGSLPVVTDDLRKELIGIVSERDLAFKVVGEARDAIRTHVYDVMTSTIFACGDEDDAITAVLAMQEHQIRRVPVVDRSGRLVGIISEGDVSVRVPPQMRLVRGLGQAA